MAKVTVTAHQMRHDQKRTWAVTVTWVHAFRAGMRREAGRGVGSGSTLCVESRAQGAPAFGRGRSASRVGAERPAVHSTQSVERVVLPWPQTFLPSKLFIVYIWNLFLQFAENLGALV